MSSILSPWFRYFNQMPLCWIICHLYKMKHSVQNRSRNWKSHLQSTANLQPVWRFPSLGSEPWTPHHGTFGSIPKSLSRFSLLACLVGTTDPIMLSGQDGIALELVVAIATLNNPTSGPPLTWRIKGTEMHWLWWFQTVYILNYHQHQHFSPCLDSPTTPRLSPLSSLRWLQTRMHF